MVKLSVIGQLEKWRSGIYNDDDEYFPSAKTIETAIRKVREVESQNGVSKWAYNSSDGEILLKFKISEGKELLVSVFEDEALIRDIDVPYQNS